MRKATMFCSTKILFKALGLALIFSKKLKTKYRKKGYKDFDATCGKAFSERKKLKFAKISYKNLRKNVTS